MAGPAFERDPCFSALLTRCSVGSIPPPAASRAASASEFSCSLQTPPFTRANLPQSAFVDGQAGVSLDWGPARSMLYPRHEVSCQQRTQTDERFLHLYARARRTAAQTANLCHGHRDADCLVSGNGSPHAVPAGQVTQTAFERCSDPERLTAAQSSYSSFETRESAEPPRAFCLAWPSARSLLVTCPGSKDKPPGPPTPGLCRGMASRPRMPAASAFPRSDVIGSCRPVYPSPHGSKTHS